MYKRIIALLCGSRHIAEEKLRQVFEILTGGAEWTKQKGAENVDWSKQKAGEAGGYARGTAKDAAGKVEDAAGKVKSEL